MSDQFNTWQLRAGPLERPAFFSELEEVIQGLVAFMGMYMIAGDGPFTDIAKAMRAGAETLENQDIIHTEQRLMRVKR